MGSIFPLFAVAFAAAAPALVTEVVPLSHFNSIELRGGGELMLRPGPIQRLTLVEGSSQFTNIRVGSDGRLKISACNARCPQHYRLRILVESPSVPVLAVEGGGAITAAAGFAVQRAVTLAVHGGGSIDARAIPVNAATAAIHGGGDIKVQPREALTAAVNGGGTVRYWGSPVVTSVIKGGGNVRPGT
jgi:Putative auto-transporter adhesin, head GIN domain